MKLLEKDVNFQYADIENQSPLSVSGSFSSTLRAPADGCDNVTNNEDDEDSISVDESQSIHNMESKLLIPKEGNQLDNAKVSVVENYSCMKNDLGFGSLQDIKSQKDSNVETRRELDKNVRDQRGEKFENDAIIGKVNTFK